MEEGPRPPARRPPPPLGCRGCLRRMRSTCSQPLLPPDQPSERKSRFIANVQHIHVRCIHVLMRDEKEGKKKEASKQGQTNNKAKQHAHVLYILHIHMAAHVHVLYMYILHIHVHMAAHVLYIAQVLLLEVVSFSRSTSSEAPPPAPPTSQSKGLFSDEEDPFSSSIPSETTPTAPPTTTSKPQ